MPPGEESQHKDCYKISGYRCVLREKSSPVIASEWRRTQWALGVPWRYPLFPASCAFRSTMAAPKLSPRPHPADSHAAGSSGATPRTVPRMCDPRNQQVRRLSHLALPRQLPSGPVVTVFFIVRTFTVNFPLRLRAQTCVEPRKSNVAGFFPCCFRTDSMSHGADRESHRGLPRPPIPLRSNETSRPE